VAKLVLDDYFSSNEFLASVDLSNSGYEQMVSSSTPLTPLNMHQPHQLITASPFVDSGINLDLMGQTPPIMTGSGGGKPFYNNKLSSQHCEMDDDVFIVEEKTTLKSNISSSSMESSTSSSSTNTAVNTGVSASSTPVNSGLSRSRRSHFSRKDSTPEQHSGPTKITDSE
jgi:hypothetical protein